MFIQALFAFLALPGIVAFAVPVTWLWLSDHTSLVQPLGIAPLFTGSLALFWCVRDFYVSGKGTLAPWAPPTRLVNVGLYRYTRNPMYISVMLILLGWVLCFGAPGQFVYTVILSVGFYLRVVLGEEPLLARKYGEEWAHYSSRVPRWFY
ncbi:methyltransferase family protein [Methylotuvimicrobium buryatense]|uniref:Isoprenylcysteine carboxylmethyltransferase family protein n=1 Tax=Methylotuvimicrobium buryatense TaxID=95641 RepID=A0A4P9URP0_METBY|nr:isoprenylcysteine carboxylmethyltransferase family protein [Methylotuvimicrobium buryatense]QCW83160.1 isoprenylcysteine carboxylmethyltransferase family protein [Methylotuvimicrobium buryatense]